MNDDDDVETVETAETETLLPDERSQIDHGMNGDADDEEDHEDPNESDNVSSIIISHH